MALEVHGERLLRSKRGVSEEVSRVLFPGSSNGKPMERAVKLLFCCVSMVRGLGPVMKITESRY